MYSILPAVSALLFLFFGAYVRHKKGSSPLVFAFGIMCFATFCWQAAWAVLFQVSDPELSLALAKLGYMVIMFVPTSLYHFLTELTESKRELPYVYVSYGFAATLSVITLFSDYLVNGYYEYFWGAYPKASYLHPVHVLQTILVVNRGLWLTFKTQRSVSPQRKILLRYCLASVLVYFFSAADYLCNYGYEFYPFGVVFLMMSLGLFAFAVTRHHLMDTRMALAASVAHEMRTPLMRIRLQSQEIAGHMPALFEAYRVGVANGLVKDSIASEDLNELESLNSSIEFEVNRSNQVIDMFLASSNQNLAASHVYEEFDLVGCVRESLSQYPMSERIREQLVLDSKTSLPVYGSKSLMMFVMFNLLKNAVYAISKAEKGAIEISYLDDRKMVFRDTASGINEQDLPYIFNEFFTTKKQGVGLGVGLAFCRRVMRSFGGEMTCRSVFGEYTEFTLTFARQPQR